MALDKILQIDEYFAGSRGLEPSVKLLEPGGPLQKTASEAEQWASSISAVPGKTFILVLAMGASEFYGPNRNGDAFSEKELKNSHHTFETNAHVFKSHVNKDPAKSFGKVLKSFYNDDMHRVELILEIDNNKAPDIVTKINSGNSVAVSMGCKIKYDVCSICGNKAPTRAQYCTHLKNELNTIYPDGRIVCADNPNPKFFDISVVWRPADKTGYMLKKVASAREYGGSSAWLAEKVAARVTLARYLNKAAEIEKLVSGVGIGVDGNTSSAEDQPSDNFLNKQWLTTVVPKIKSSFIELTDEDKQFLSTRNLPKVLSTLSKMGIFLATPEFLDLVYIKMSGKKAPQGLASNLISLQGDIFSMLAKHPELAEELIKQRIAPTGSEEQDDLTKEKMAKYIPLRSLNENWVLSGSSDFLKQSSRELCHSNLRLPFNTKNNPQLDKIASIAYSVYITNLQDRDANPNYTKLASLVSESCDGTRNEIPAPWVPITVIALNRQFVN